MKSLLINIKNKIIYAKMHVALGVFFSIFVMCNVVIYLYTNLLILKVFLYSPYIAVNPDCRTTTGQLYDHL